MSEYATTADVKAWDTEYGDYVIWGTHSPSLARRAVRKYLLEIEAELPQYLDELTPPFADFEKARKMWANPKCMETEEVWPKEMIARHDDGYIPHDGWVPYMVVAL